MTDSQSAYKPAAEKAYTPCATCGRRMPPEKDSRTVVFCSPACYGRDVQARGVVHIYPTEPTCDLPFGDGYTCDLPRGHS